jgi:hypothetical protein
MTRKSKGKGGRSSFRPFRPAKGKGKKGKHGKGYYSDDWYDTNWEQPVDSYYGKGKKGKKGKSKGKKGKDISAGKGPDNANANIAVADQQGQVQDPSTRVVEATGSEWNETWIAETWSDNWNATEWYDDSWFSMNMTNVSWYVRHHERQEIAQAYISRDLAPHKAKLPDMIEISQHPSYVVLDLGCTRSMGSRRAITRLLAACQNTGVTYEILPVSSKFSFANSQTAHVYECVRIWFNTNPPCHTGHRHSGRRQCPGATKSEADEKSLLHIAFDARGMLHHLPSLRFS